MKNRNKISSNPDQLLDFKSQAPSTIYPQNKLNMQESDANTSIQEDDDFDQRGTIMTDGSKVFFNHNGQQVKPNQDLLNSAPMNIPAQNFEKSKTQNLVSSEEIENSTEEAQQNE